MLAVGVGRSKQDHLSCQAHVRRPFLWSCGMSFAVEQFSSPEDDELSLADVELLMKRYDSAEKRQKNDHAGGDPDVSDKKTRVQEIAHDAVNALVITELPPSPSLNLHMGTIQGTTAGMSSGGQIVARQQPQGVAGALVKYDSQRQGRTVNLVSHMQSPVRHSDGQQWCNPLSPTVGPNVQPNRAAGVGTRGQVVLRQQQQGAEGAGTLVGYNMQEKGRTGHQAFHVDNHGRFSDGQRWHGPSNGGAAANSSGAPRVSQNASSGQMHERPGPIMMNSAIVERQQGPMCAYPDPGTEWSGQGMPMQLESMHAPPPASNHGFGAVPPPEEFKRTLNAGNLVLSKQDYMKMGRNTFIKRSGLRKIAAYYSVSFEIREKKIERDAAKNVVYAEFVVRAHLPNEKKSNANPNHVIPATADTRAKSRACQDLTGIGECDSD
eukprot:jgi/Mesen1/5173/ME000257S04449